MPVILLLLLKIIYFDLQTPLDSSSVDVAVFCLSLMGTDFPSYLQEANRVLKPQYAFDIVFLFLKLQTVLYTSFDNASSIVEMQWVAFNS